MVIEGGAPYRKMLANRVSARQSAKRKRELAFSSPAPTKATVTSRRNTATGLEGLMSKPSRPDMIESLATIGGAYASKAARKVFPYAFSPISTGLGKTIRDMVLPEYSSADVRDMTPEERKEATSDIFSFIPGVGSVTDVKRVEEKEGVTSPWTIGSAGVVAADITPGNIFSTVAAGSIRRSQRLADEARKTTTLRQFWGDDRVDTSALTRITDTTTRPEIRGVQYYESNLEPLNSDEIVEFNELLEKGVRAEGTTRQGQKGSWFDVNNPESVRLRELSARSAGEIITVDSPEALRQVITGVKGANDRPTSMIGGSTVRPRGVVFEGGLMGVIEAGGDLSRIDAEDALLAEFGYTGMGQPSPGQIAARKQGILKRAEKGPSPLRSRNPEKPGVLDISLEDFEPGTYIINREPTAEEVLAQLRRTDKQAAGRAKKLNKRFKPTEYTLEDAQDLINQWRAVNPDAPWGVWRQTTRKTRQGELVDDYEWVAGGTIEHIDPVKTTRKQRVGQKGNVIILDSSLNASKGDRPLFTTGKTTGWLKSIRQAKTDIVDKRGKVIVKKGDDRFVEEADQIAQRYGATWDPSIQDYVFI